MKTTTLMLALVIFGISFANAQEPDQPTKIDCEKKVMKKIKRKMQTVNFKDYVASGQMAKAIITCHVNEDNEVEVAKIEGLNGELNTAIVETLANNPVKCDDQPKGQEFSFITTFKHISL